MELSFEQYEHIQDYLDGMMPADRREDFEKELAADPVLAEHLSFEKEFRKNLASIEKDRIMDSGVDVPATGNKFDDPSYILGLIDAAGQEFKKKGDQTFHRQSKVISIGYKTGWAIAASVIIVVACALLFLTPSSHTGNGIAHKQDTGNKKNGPDSVPVTPPPVETNFAALFKQFFTKDPAPEEKPVYLAAELDDYDRGKYGGIESKALVNIPVYRDVVNSPENVLEQGHFYKGMAFTQTGNSREATRHLQWVIDHARSQQLILKARWYLALVYLKEKNSDKAVPLLNAIAESNQSTPYKDDAKKLMNLLKE